MPFVLLDVCLFDLIYTPSLDYFVRARQDVRRNREADLLGRLQIDHQLELVGCSTGRSAGLAPLRILSM
jgi:hypothetical protein